MSDPIDTAKECAIATGKIADAADTGIKATEKLGGWASKYINYPLQELSGIVGDKLAHYRLDNQQRFMNRVNELSCKEGIEAPTSTIEMKLALPLLEGASMENDEGLQDLWAKLLINATNKDSDYQLHRIQIDLLESLTSLEAQILQEVYSIGSLGGNVNVPSLYEKLIKETYTYPMQRSENEPVNDFDIAILNLIDLRCLALLTSEFEIASGRLPVLGSGDFNDGKQLNQVQIIKSHDSENSSPYCKLPLKLSKTVKGERLVRACTLKSDDKDD